MLVPVGTVRVDGRAVIMVASVALASAEPPPDTPTRFVTCDGAFDATFTVTVMDG